MEFNWWSLLAQIEGSVYWWAVSVVLVLSFSVVEERFAAEPGHGNPGRWRNFVYSILYVGLGTGITYPVLVWIGDFSLAEEAQRTPAGSAALVFTALLITDFFYYWYHRAQHRFSWLWLIHEMHHADTELNATTSWRTHFLEQPIQLLIVSVPGIYLVGHLPGLQALHMNHDELFAYTLVASIWLVFTHANLRLPLGRWCVLVVGPQYHRIHHSRLPQHRDRNFAQYFPVFDLLFGTCVKPNQQDYPATGTEQLASDAAIWTTVWRPFALWRQRLTATILRS